MKDGNTEYAVINHYKKEVSLYGRKMDAIYHHVKFNRKQKVQFKEVKNHKVLPKDYEVIEK